MVYATTKKNKQVKIKAVDGQTGLFIPAQTKGPSPLLARVDRDKFDTATVYLPWLKVIGGNSESSPRLSSAAGTGGESCGGVRDTSSSAALFSLSEWGKEDLDMLPAN